MALWVIKRGQNFVIFELRPPVFEIIDILDIR